MGSKWVGAEAEVSGERFLETLSERRNTSLNFAFDTMSSGCLTGIRCLLLSLTFIFFLLECFCV